MQHASISSRLKDALTHLPYLTDHLPGISGTIKTIPEHFQVQEVMPYAACGEGEHVYVTLRRKEWNTADVARELQKAFTLRATDVGWAGRKDKTAVATQTFSLRLPLPAATTSPRTGFSVALSGITMPPGEVRSSSMRLMITRS